MSDAGDMIGIVGRRTMKAPSSGLETGESLLAPYDRAGTLLTGLMLGAYHLIDPNHFCCQRQRMMRRF